MSGNFLVFNAGSPPFGRHGHVHAIERIGCGAAVLDKAANLAPVNPAVSLLVCKSAPRRGTPCHFSPWQVEQFPANSCLRLDFSFEPLW